MLAENALKIMAINKLRIKARKITSITKLNLKFDKKWAKLVAHIKFYWKILPL